MEASRVSFCDERAASGRSSRAAVLRAAFFKPGDIRPNVRMMVEALDGIDPLGSGYAFRAGARRSVGDHHPAGEVTGRAAAQATAIRGRAAQRFAIG